MAIASYDAAMAMVTLGEILADVFEQGVFPRKVDGEFATDPPDYFDPDDADHLRALYDRVDAFMGATAPTCGDLRRVLLGYTVLTDPVNRVVDRSKPHLALHPRFDELLAAACHAKECLLGVGETFLDAGEPDGGCDKVTAQLTAALAQFGGDPTPPAPALSGILAKPLRALFAALDIKLAAELRAGVLHKGTALAVAMMMRDSVRTLDAQLAESLTFTNSEEVAKP